MRGEQHDLAKDDAIADGDDGCDLRRGTVNGADSDAERPVKDLGSGGLPRFTKRVADRFFGQQCRWRFLSLGTRRVNEFPCKFADAAGKAAQSPGEQALRNETAAVTQDFHIQNVMPRSGRDVVEARNQRLLLC